MEQRITGRDSYGLGAQGVVSDTQILSLYSYIVFDVNTVKDVVALGWHLSWHHFTPLPWAPTPQASGLRLCGGSSFSPACRLNAGGSLGQGGRQYSSLALTAFPPTTTLGEVL